ncbi:DUF427 domain-containing protein [Vreelandella andesensis]|uniref:DUF427 domain-containing protein n=1 Tax=Vreelandella andesensis TaxID=447567 RepID=A0A3S0W6A9_9GAMM|nr:DUF427 domain-containing protein [Halomonas andesensis]RUR29475.1 DUF427 domain-containing protein [Halomonas andesensis]
MQNAPRIEPYSISQRVQAQADGTLIADSTNTLELRERGYPPCHYFPCEDVRMDLLNVSESSYCPFKGNTVHFSLGRIQDIAWSYEQPIEGMEAIAGRVAFYKEVSK